MKKFLLIILLLLVAVIACRLVSRELFFRMVSQSMEPAVHPGNHILIDKNAYKHQEPQRGDMVIYILPENENRKFVHRLVGLPNETMEIKNGKIFINGSSLNEGVFAKIY